MARSDQTGNQLQALLKTADKLTGEWLINPKLRNAKVWKDSNSHDGSQTDDRLCSEETIPQSIQQHRGATASMLTTSILRAGPKLSETGQNAAKS